MTTLSCFFIYTEILRLQKVSPLLITVAFFEICLSYSSMLSRAVIMNLSAITFSLSKYLDLSWSQYLEKKSSKMIRNIQNETSIIKNKIVDSLITLFAEVLLFFSIVLLLIFTIPKITLGILSVIILIGVLTYKIMKA